MSKKHIYKKIIYLHYFAISICKSLAKAAAMHVLNKPGSPLDLPRCLTILLE